MCFVVLASLIMPCECHSFTSPKILAVTNQKRAGNVHVPVWLKGQDKDSLRLNL